MPYFHYQSKKIYYRETGFGKPLVMLHGDTASSVMFEFLLPLYQESFRVILMDFLGNGKSDRVEGFPENLWITEAEQVIGLIEHLKLEKVNLLGTSGGAWVAVNTADLHARQFYEWCQGEDWEAVVDLNTQALTKCAEDRIPLFCRPLEDLRTPILFVGSAEDEMCRGDMEEEYAQMSRLVQDGTVHMFKTGGHPAVLTNAEPFAGVVIEYLGS